MKSLILKNLFSVSLCIAIIACSNEKPKKYSTTVGFTNLTLFDNSRDYFTNDSLRTGRPISVLIWLPAEEQTEIDTLSLNDYLALSVSDTNENTRLKAEAIMKDLLYGYGFDSLALDSLYLKVKQMRSPLSRFNENRSQRYPVLLLSTALNAEAIYYTALAEFLASNGFIVAALNSPGNSVSEPAGYDQEGINNQLKDLQYALMELKKQSFIDTTRIAIGSWSTGGISAALLQMTHSEIKAFVSFDGGTGYSYGWELLTQSPYYDSSAQIIPAIHFHGTATPTRVEKNFNHIKSFKSNNTYLVELKHLNHYHFTSVAQYFNSLQAEPNKEFLHGYDDLKTFTLTFLNHYLQDQKIGDSEKIEVMKGLETEYIHVDHINNLQ